MIYSFSFAQNCEYQVIINSENLKETGKFKLTILSRDTEPFKIPKQINLCNIRLTDLEIYNKTKEAFEKMKLANKDIDCFTFKDKVIKLKSDKTKVYTVDIKSDFETLQETNFFKTLDNEKYRLKISFPLGSYVQCGASNNVKTDWIYKN